MRKKVYMIILAGVLALSMSACGGDKDNNTESAAESVSSAAESVESAVEGDVQALVPEKEGEDGGGSREIPVGLDEEEPVDLDELDELPDEFEPAGEGPEDAEWNN